MQRISGKDGLGFALACLIFSGFLSSSTAQVPAVDLAANWSAASSLQSPDRPQSEAQQGEIDKLRNTKEKFVSLSIRIDEMLGKDEGLRPGLIALAKEPKLPNNVLLGLGSSFARGKVQEVLPFYTELLAGNRLNEREKVDLQRFILSEFHRNESILGRLDTALTSARKEPNRFQNFLDGLLAIVNESQQPGVDRFAAAERLVKLWKFHGHDMDPKAEASLRAALRSLTEEVYDGDGPELWMLWLDRFREAGETPPRLETQAILRYALSEQANEMQRLVKERRAEVAQLINRMREDGNPPVDLVRKLDPDIRRNALTAIRSMVPNLGAEELEKSLASLFQSLSEVSPMARSHPGLVGDVLAAAGELTAVTAEDSEYRKKISDLLFDIDAGKHPLLVQTQLEIALRLGINGDRATQAITTLYQIGLEAGRADKQAWIDVRSVAVEAAKPPKPPSTELPLVLMALEDPSKRVRGVAASTCILLKDELAQSGHSPVAKLVARGTKEADAVTKQRMFDAAEKIADVRPASYDEAVIADLLVAAENSVNGTRLVIMRMFCRILALDGADEAAKTKVVAALRSALADTKSASIAHGTARIMAGKYLPVMRESLIEWVAASKKVDDTWKAVKGALLQGEGARPEAMWTLAQACAGHGEALWFDEAADLGSKALAALEGDSPEIVERTAEWSEKLLLWRESASLAKHHRAALVTIDQFLIDRPNEGPLSRRAGDLRMKLAKQPKASNLTELREKARANYEAALAETAVGLSAEDRRYVQRQLMSLHADMARWEIVGEIFASLKTSGELTRQDRFLGACAAVEDATSKKNQVSALLDQIPESELRDLAQPVALVRVAGFLTRFDRLDVEGARSLLASKTLAERGGRLISQLKGRLAALDKVEPVYEKLKAAVGEERAPMIGELLSMGEPARAWIAARLLDETLKASEASLLVDLNRRLNSKDDFWAGLKAPAADDAEGWKTLRARIEAWSRGQRIGERLIRVY